VPEKSLLLAGIRLDAMDMATLIELIASLVEQKQKALVLSHNLHSIFLYETVPAFRPIHDRADFIYIDGMPVVWLGQLAGLPVAKQHRITFLDSMESMMQQAADHHWRVFYFGGTEEVLQSGIAVLRSRYPHLNISGRNGYLNDLEKDSEAAVQQINEFQPDLLFVGMGMPLQERWVESYYDRLDARVVFTCGATLSYISGHSYKPPAWASSLGLYGLMRLTKDPARLWRRYLVEPLYLLAKLGPRILRQRLASGKHPEGR
jgi:N-acetylglucosaminyldiphosphoundecaprenol N-acetyl-beta-D-mannosaminyltransferase